MNPERWQRITEVFEAALERPADGRAQFLVQACNGDQALLAEVDESLLSEHERAGSFIQKPVLDSALSPRGQSAGESAVSPSSDRSLIGQALSHYQILGQLGQGGMGKVYLVQDTRLKRQVALKLLPSDFARNLDRMRRFEQEARPASSLNHPNIITIHEIGESEAGHFIVMEFVEGQTLRKVADERPSLESTVQTCGQVARALRVAHKSGIVHRDIKPENIMVRSDGYVKVLDFGLASLSDDNLAVPAPAGETRTKAAATDEALTASGMVLGTIRYMSPEQARGERVGSATDIFSLGLILYELTTGQHPFGADSRIGTLHAIISQPVLPPRRLNLEINDDLEALILRMLEKDVRLRPSTEEVNKALSGLAGRGAETTAAGYPLAAKRHTVGRKRERAELRAGFESVLRGRGLLMCVAGEPGIGKTTLVEDFLAELRVSGNGCRIAIGRCSERLAGTEAYLPFLEVLDRLLHGDDGAQVARLMKALAPNWYLQVVPLAADSSDVRRLAEVQAGSQERMKLEMSAFLQDFSRTRPLAIFLDDLHWADVSTVDLLVYIATRFELMRVLIVATYRPSELLLSKHPFLQVKPDLVAHGVCREAVLDFLSREEVEKYLTMEFSEESFTADLTNLIYSKTEGNPLFMVDLVRYLRAKKVVEFLEGHWKLVKTLPEAERELPESVRSMIQKKIDQLGEEDRRVLIAASVQGHKFDSAVVSRSLEMDPANVEDRLDVIERVHSFVSFVGEGEFPDRTSTLKYRFVHVLYQNSLYASLRSTRRALLSRAVADALLKHYGEHCQEVASDLASLFEVARDFVRAAEYFLLAGQHASRLFASQEAVLLARRGLESLRTLPETPERNRLELLLQTTLGLSLGATSGLAVPEVGKAYDRARELSRALDDDNQLFRILVGLWAYYTVRAEISSSLELGKELLLLGERLGDPLQLAEAHQAIGIALHHMGDHPAALDHFERGIALCDPKTQGSRSSSLPLDPGVTCRCESARVLWLLGYPDKAMLRIHEALLFVNEVPHPNSEGFALVFGTFIHQLRGETEEVLELAAVVLELGRKYHLATPLAWIGGFHGWALTKQGKTEDGIAEIRHSLAIQRNAGSEIARTQYLAILADVHKEAGQVTEALEVVDEAFRTAELTGDRYYDAELHRLKGELQLMESAHSGDALIEEAEKSFLQALEVARRQGARSFELRAVMSLGRLHQRQSRHEQARQQLQEIYSWFTEGFNTADLREARRLLEEWS